ncbi:DUF6701 domain-containing protein [Roseateles sp.]|uniref:DUF6701 domain-containing protein n=1 Tax=Roseateles sp. TaxID=1971397 RepID=UPI002E0BCA73|nr:DUF6701 domain-containing protein [Roseateles sp.]
MRRWLHFALVLAVLCTPLLARAVAYTFPSSMPAGCSGSGGSYTCTGLTLGYGDTIAIAGTKPATLTINGNLSTDTSQINVAGSASDLTLNISGTLTFGYQAKITANVTAGSVNDAGGGNVTITGNLAASGGNVSLAYKSSVTGNLSTSGTGTLTTGQNGSIGGSISAGTGAITISPGSTVYGSVSGGGSISVGQSAVVSGDLSAGSGAVNIGYQAKVNGNLSTSGAITTGQGSLVGGNIAGGAGNVSIGYGATVSGTLTTTTGTITFAQIAVASSCVKSTGSASITLGYQSSINSVCCGNTCSNSCVVNNSNTSMPPLCSGATPTLVSGSRYSFESYDVPGSYIRHYNFLGYINPVSASSDALTLSDSTFVARPGLSNSSCWSFESVNYPGYYLRHNNFVLKLNAYSATAPFPADATFCLRAGLANAAAVSFEASNYAGYYLQHKTDTSMILATTDGTAAANGRATFYPRPGWAPAVEHYELSAPSTGIACQAATLTVTACADSSSPCTSPLATMSGQSATLATTAGTLGSATVTFDGSGTATTTLAYPGAGAGSTATVTLSGESLTASSARRCCADGTSCSAANSCSTSFGNAGFIIAASAGGGAATVPTQTAGNSSGSWVLRAVKTNTTTKACEAALSGTTTVNWGVQCNDPTTCSAGNKMTLTGSSAVAVAGNANGSSAASTAVSMSFDANGNAPFSFSYADVGRVTLLASKAAGGSLLTALSGSSNAFVVKPAGLVLSAIRCTNFAAGACATTAIPSPGNNPGPSSAGGSAFLPAGKPFSATVTAVDASGNATPNFGRETTPEGVTLTATLVQPAGGNAPALSNPSAFGSFNGGVATGTSFAWPEVGIITLTPALADGSYLGAGNVTGTTSGNVGRFVPAWFTLSNATVTHRSAAGCSPASTFTYLNENFSLGFTLTARNAAGTTTQNYAGSFAKLDPTAASGWNLAGLGGTTSFSTVGGRLALGSASGSWSAGVATVSLSAAALQGATADGPFNASFGIAPVDSDGVAVQTLDLDTDYPSNGVDRALLATVALRYGRLRLQNAMGAANRVLRLPLAAQYWDGSTSSFKTNDLDSCTRISSANLSFGNFRRALTSADAVMSPATVTVDPTQPVFITLAAPNGSRVGSLDVAVALGATNADASCLKTAAGWTPALAASAGANLAGLRGAWCGTAATSDPSARATWGLYRGADGVVYQRENY